MAKYAKYLWAVILLASCGGQSTAVKTQSAEAAIDRLKAIDAATSISTNITNYGQLLVAAKPAVDEYLAVDSTSDLALAIDKTFSGHRLAFDWWQCKFAESETGDSFYDFQAQAECRDELLPVLVGLYPEVESKITEAIEVKEAKLEKPLSNKSDALDADSIIQLIWQKTGATMDEVDELAG